MSAHVTDDAFLGGALRILQPGVGYRAGLDAVLLAAAIDASPGAHIVDVGSGVGVAGLAAAWRLPGIAVTLVERDRRLADLAHDNIVRNGLGARVRIITADVTCPLGEAPELAAGAGMFDHALANPPYHAVERGTPAADPVKATANAMAAGGLDRWLRFMAAMVRPGGSATLIHRADALHEVLNALAGRFGDVLVLPLHPRAGEAASRVLVHATKGSRALLSVRPGLVLHDTGHSFRPEIEAVLRHGAGFAAGILR